MWIHRDRWFELGLFVIGFTANIAVIRDVIVQAELGLPALVKIVFKNICNGSVARPVASGCAAARGLHPLGCILFGQGQNPLGLLVANLRVVVLVDQPLDIALAVRPDAPGQAGKPLGIPVVIRLMSRRHMGSSGGICPRRSAALVMGDALPAIT